MLVEKTMCGKKIVNATNHTGVSMRKVVTTFSNEGIGKNLSDYLIDINSSMNKEEDLGEHLLGEADVRGVANVDPGGQGAARGRLRSPPAIMESSSKSWGRS